MKIAHITTANSSLRYLLLNQLTSLGQDGYEVVGISPPGNHLEGSSPFRYIPIPMTRRISPVQDLISLFSLCKLFVRERFTVVHTHQPKPGLLGQIAARLAKVPIRLHTLHGFYFHENMAPTSRRLYKSIEQFTVRCTDMTLSQNREDIKTAFCEGICSKSKIKYIGNGIDIRRFDPGHLCPASISQRQSEFNICTGSPVVGFVGRLVIDKGLLEFYQAARIILEHEPRVRFLIVGQPDYDKSDALIPDVARKYEVFDSCIFAGQREDMPALYALMDVFVLPSHREGFPRAPMEACAMGIPCVLTDVRGCREVVEHNRNGLLVPPKDAPALAAAILRLLKDKEAAARMSKEAHRIAQERFDERVVFDRIKAQYARLLAAKGFPLPFTQPYDPTLPYTSRCTAK